MAGDSARRAVCCLGLPGVVAGCPRLVRVNAVLTAKGLSAGHADRVIFSGVDLVVSPGKVIGLVGANGAGKSTLLRMLAGLDDSARDAGSVSLNPPTAAVGYLPQEPERGAGGGRRVRGGIRPVDEPGRGGPGGANRESRCLARAGRAARGADDLAVRRAGRAGESRVAPVVAVRHLPA